MRWWFKREEKRLQEVGVVSNHGDKTRLQEVGVVSNHGDKTRLQEVGVVSNHGDKKTLQKGMIITDDISFSPILDFDDYVVSLTKIIKNSYPKFSIGIYGEWGTGKTTLMRSIYNRLKENNENNSIIAVWFNAWRYEREEQFAIMPLLKTIAYAIPDNAEFKGLKEKIKKGGINVLKKMPDIIPTIAGQYFGEGAKKVTEEMINNFKKEFIPKLELIAEVDKETIYFDGLDNIGTELQNIRDKNDSFKIVVFVDDLDRCSPDKALQVLESIKVFLDSDGFIYVIGLSFNKISQLITAYYKDKYKEIGIEGDQYLKKIIQIPIILSDWNSDDIKVLIKSFITDKTIENEGYRKIIEENLDLISSGLEENPRETKRFLNNFIVAQEIFSKKGTKPKELLVLQILNMRWNEIYRLIVNSHGEYLEKLEPYVTGTKDLKKLSITKQEEIESQPELTTLQKFRTDQDLWKFLQGNFDVMKNISNWHVYRRATKISDEPILQSKWDRKKALELLKRGYVKEFNKMRETVPSKELDFTGAELAGTNLSGVNLSGANLSKADFYSADLNNANLSGSILDTTNLQSASLENANLENANLTFINATTCLLRNANLKGVITRNVFLSYADLTGADLTNAVLGGAHLDGADLSRANLQNCVLMFVTYTKMKLDNYTKIDEAITDDSKLILYLTKYTKNPPKRIKDKKELRLKLKLLDLPPTIIDGLIESSSLPS
jgi:KAP family P-loop domain/Pentapeptide repeats (8 copies)